MEEAKLPPERSSNELAVDRTDMAGERTDLAQGRTDLAYERTRLASDRTTMAYMRTSVSLIGFGFTIYKFFQYMADVPGFEGVPSIGARRLGVALLLLGAVMLIVAVVQQIVFMKRLSSDSGQKFPISTSLVASIFLVVVGMLALARIIFHVGPF